MVKKLLHNLIIVQEQDIEDLKKGGLEVPGTLESTPRYGKVTHAGIEAVNVKEGDMILWRNQAGEEIYIDNVTHLLMTEKDVVAIV
jgi:co-chaperonin GroES (HSP10)